MKRLQQFLLIIFTVFLIQACEDAPEGIQQALFDETGVADPELRLLTNIAYDSGSNFQYNWGDLIGVDFRVTNQNENEVTDIVIQIASVSNPSAFSDYPSDTREISFLSSFSTLTPSGYWCFDCNTSSELRVGNFYYELAPNSGTQSLTVTYSVRFRYEGENYTQSFEDTFTVFN